MKFYRKINMGKSCNELYYNQLIPQLQLIDRGSLFKYKNQSRARSIVFTSDIGASDIHNGRILLISLEDIKVKNDEAIFIDDDSDHFISITLMLDQIITLKNHLVNIIEISNQNMELQQ